MRVMDQVWPCHPRSRTASKRAEKRIPDTKKTATGKNAEIAARSKTAETKSTEKNE